MKRLCVSHRGTAQAALENNARARGSVRSSSTTALLCRRRKPASTSTRASSINRPSSHLRDQLWDSSTAIHMAKDKEGGLVNNQREDYNFLSRASSVTDLDQAFDVASAPWVTPCSRATMAPSSPTDRQALARPSRSRAARSDTLTVASSRAHSPTSSPSSPSSRASSSRCASRTLKSTTRRDTTCSIRRTRPRVWRTCRRCRCRRITTARSTCAICPLSSRATRRRPSTFSSWATPTV